MSIAQSSQTQARLLRLPYPDDVADRFETLAEQSMQAQRQIEANDRVSFEVYRAAYVAPERLGH